MKYPSQKSDNDCYKVCVEYITKLENLPNFFLGSPKNWNWRDQVNFLEDKGFVVINVPVNETSNYIFPESVCILTGPSPAEMPCDHSVLGKFKNNKPIIIHDPLKDSVGLKTISDLTYIFKEI